MKITDKFVLFWGGEFSNWATVPNGIPVYVGGELHKFKTSEQLFMYCKAIYFNDLGTAAEILEAETPKEAKELGRRVKGFSETEWEKVREGIMKLVIMEKVHAWPLFKNALLKLGEGKKFVEASPVDKVWGIGLGEDDPNAQDETKWKGLNLLGKTLDQVREEIKKIRK